MKSIEHETQTLTSKELLEDAVDGIQRKVAKLHIAAYQEQTKDGLGRLIAAQSEIIQNAINSLKDIKGRL